MRLGINTFLFTSPFTTESTKLFPKFKKWGFETVEIPVEDPSHIDPAKVKAALDKNGLVCGSVCACMGPGRDLRGTPAEQKTAMDYCKNTHRPDGGAGLPVADRPGLFRGRQGGRRGTGGSRRRSGRWW